MMQRLNFGTNAATNRNISFHARYLDLCRTKNLLPLPDVCGKKRMSKDTLDIFGEKLQLNDWMLIIDALQYDKVLLTLGIKLRRCNSAVLDHIDTELKVKRFKQKPIIYTKYVFNKLINSLTLCLNNNNNIVTLRLEALPLTVNYLELIVKSIAQNRSLKEVSFKRSPIGDDGCETICDILKYMDNIEKIDFSECCLTKTGANFVCNLIKIKKIRRYSEAWQMSLRYCAIDSIETKGLNSIALAKNPNIGDDGLKLIIEILKEDSWIKHIDFENCGLTDISANLILECLNINDNILSFKINANPGINNKAIIKKINEHFEKDQNGRINTTVADQRNKTEQLREQIERIREKFNLEKNMRKKAELLNQKLQAQIDAYQTQLDEEETTDPTKMVYEYIKNDIPEGFVIISIESLNSIIKEHNDLQDLVDIVNPTRNKSPRLTLTTRDEKRRIISIDTVVILTPKVAKNLPHKPLRATQNRDLRKFFLRNIKSEIQYVEPKNQVIKQYSKSDSQLYDENLKTEKEKPIIIETNIGDTIANNKTRNNRIIANSEKILILNSEELQNYVIKQKPQAQYTNFDIEELQLQEARSSNNSDSENSNLSAQKCNCQKYELASDVVTAKTITNCDFDTAKTITNEHCPTISTCTSCSTAKTITNDKYANNAALNSFFNDVKLCYKKDSQNDTKQSK